MRRRPRRDIIIQWCCRTDDFAQEKIFAKPASGTSSEAIVYFQERVNIRCCLDAGDLVTAAWYIYIVNEVTYSQHSFSIDGERYAQHSITLTNPVCIAYTVKHFLEEE